MNPISAAFICLKGQELSPAEAGILKRYQPAGLTLFKRNIDHPDQVRKLTTDIRDAVGRDDFLIAIDQEGGLVRRLRPPHWPDYVSQSQLGTLPDPQATEAVRLHAGLIARDLHDLGINVVFAPVADILHTDTTGAIASRCFGSDPAVVARYAALMARTYMENGICPCMKHLPGHGLANTDSHIGLPVIDCAFEKIERDFLPFREMADFIPLGMTAHVVLPMIDDKPVTQSAKGINLIRTQIGFDGLLITDAIEMKALSGTLTEKTELSLNAGCDLVCYCSGHDQNNPDMTAENEAVLVAAGPAGDKTLARLAVIDDIIKIPVSFKGSDVWQKRYEELTNPVQNTPLKGPDYTENWSDRQTK